MKKKVSILTAVVIVAVLVVSLFASCGKKENTASDLAYIKDKGKLVIGVTEYDPMNYKDENGNWIGFDTEYAQAVAEKLGVEVEFTILPDWDEKYTELKAKSIDCAWNGLTIDDAAKKNASLTKAYAKNAQVVVMAKDKLAQFTDAASLKDLKIAVENGSAGQKAAEENGLTNVTALPDQAGALLEVKSGAADACIVDLTLAASVTGEGKSYADFGYAIELTKEEFGIACRQGSDLPAEIDRITAELEADGTLQKLAEKYPVALVK